MSLNIYFLRHGETTASRTGGYCGTLDIDLTEVGTQMAQAFADAYRDLPWAAVYTSPLRRTVATAQPLCEAIGLQMQVRAGLREIEYGQWEGLTVEAVRQQYEEDYVRWLTEPAWNPPTGGETAVQVASRASLVIAEIENQYADGNVLVVSHKATIRILLCSLLGIDLGRFRDRIDMPVAAVSVVKFDVHGPLLQRLGDRAHLPPALRALPGT
ncbi:histidine phosphatase family protein [Trichothermofontia sichuanensis B231]|uniref:histidine phosphatase family protein n=1 Tax=Trichothermofontia sichuanensis TaxID=3045816 RepID=UPI0022484104|nr:histidine phosphatase family protein [Trichothermofontia sichuanensis]UZQ55815.1 histidine phosphatase family protein [Trichothermofontia sichuanensis B231]